MTPEQIQAYIAAGAILVQGGLATVQQVRGIIAMLHPDLPEDQLNAILVALRDDSARRVVMARAAQDAAQQAAADAADA